MNKTTLRILSKIGLLLVIIGFFMPVACNQNGFELAKMAASGPRGASGLTIAFYALFAFACLGAILLFVIASKKNVPMGWDWFATLGAIVSAVIVYVQMSDNLPSRGALFDVLQSGAYVIMCGLAVSLIVLFMASSAKESPQENPAENLSGIPEAEEKKET